MCKHGIMRKINMSYKMKIQRLIWSKLRRVRTPVDIVAKNSPTFRNIAQPKENNVETAIVSSSTILPNYADL